MAVSRYNDLTTKADMMGIGDDLMAYMEAFLNVYEKRNGVFICERPNSDSCSWKKKNKCTAPCWCSTKVWKNK